MLNGNFEHTPLMPKRLNECGTRPRLRYPWWPLVTQGGHDHEEIHAPRFLDR
jgi:hypothetical protein